VDAQEARRRTLFLTVVAASVLWVLYQAQEAVLPLVVALLCAYLLFPLVVLLQRRGFSRLIAVSTLFLLFFGALGCAIGLALPPILSEGSALLRRTLGEPGRTEENIHRIMKETDDLPPEAAVPRFLKDNPGWSRGDYEDRSLYYQDRNGDGRFDPGYAFKAALAFSGKLREWGLPPEVAEMAEDLGIEALPKVAAVLAGRSGDVAKGAVSVLGTTLRVLGWLIIVPLFTFFFLMRLEAVWNAFQRYLPGTHRERVVRVLGEIHRMLLGFFRGRLLTMLLKGLFVAAALLAAGAPYWPVLGAASGLLTIVPVAGVVLTAGPGIILAYAERGPNGALLAAGVFLAAELVEGYYLIPRLVGREVGLGAMEVIAAILVGAALLGLLGVVLAVPLAAAVKIVWREYVLPDLEAKAAEAPGRGKK